MIGPIGEDPGSDCEKVHALLRTNTGHRDIDRIDELRDAAIDGDDSETAADSGIDAEDLIGRPRSCAGMTIGYANA
jgi:hypothetical protein